MTRVEMRYSVYRKRSRLLLFGECIFMRVSFVPGTADIFIELQSKSATIAQYPLPQRISSRPALLPPTIRMPSEREVRCERCIGKFQYSPFQFAKDRGKAKKD